MQSMFSTNLISNRSTSLFNSGTVNGGYLVPALFGFQSCNYFVWTFSITPCYIYLLCSLQP